MGAKKEKKRMNGALRGGNEQEGTALKMTRPSHLNEKKNLNRGGARRATVSAFQINMCGITALGRMTYISRFFFGFFCEMHSA